MQAEAKRRWIAGAIAGAERLCLPLPWERGGRRARMLQRRRAAAEAARRPAALTGTARSDRTEGGPAPLTGPGIDDFLTD
jgi:hypothetical protein